MIGPREPRRWYQRYRRHVPAAIALGVGLTLSIIAFVLVRDFEAEKAREEFEHRTILVAAQLKQAIDISLDDLYFIADFRTASPSVDRSTFRAFVTPALRRQPVVLAYGWARRVADAARSEYEAAVRAEGFQTFEISERDAKAGTIRASQRPEYFPIHYRESLVAPDAGKILGFDQASNPSTAAARERALTTGRASVSGRLGTLASNSRAYGFVALVPVYRSTAPATIHEREAGLAGFALAVFQIDRLVEATFAQLTPRYMDIVVLDRSAEVDERLLYASPALASKLDPLLHDTAARGRRTIDVGGRQWEMLFRPGDGYPANPGDWEAWAVLGVGLVLTTLVSGHLYARERQTGALRKALHQTAAAEAKYRAIFDHAIAGMFQATIDGRYVMTNAALARIYGFASPEELEATSMDPTCHAELSRLLSTMDVVSGHESRVPRRDGNIIWVSQNVRAVRDHRGEILYLEGSVQNITEQKEAEQMKSDFISFATHQLRTPLAGIRWLLELAAHETASPDTVQSYVEDARASAERLIHLVNDLLGVSRLESGRLVPKLVDTRITELTRSVLDELGVLARERHQRLSMTAADDDARVMADPQLLRQVILNLTSNAITYTPKGGEITVRIGSDAHQVRWEVQDNGIGIPKEAQTRLFEKFYRADNAATLEAEGTGLGLYMVRLIVERHGGRVWYESEEQRGSTFFFSVPCKG